MLYEVITVAYKPLFEEDCREGQPKISPNGLWIAYLSDESGRNEVYVRPFPEVNKGRWQISENGGDSPLWSPDGKELYYRNGDSVIAVSVQTEPVFKRLKQEVLFQGTYVSLSGQDAHTWDISPDGKRFLMMKPSVATEGESTAETPRKINVVLNWT